LPTSLWTPSAFSLINRSALALHSFPFDDSREFLRPTVFLI
jgi:hypothetical protein